MWGLLCGEQCDSAGVEIPLAMKDLPPGHFLSFFSRLSFRIWLEVPVGGAVDYVMVFPAFQAHKAVSGELRYGTCHFYTRYTGIYKNQYCVWKSS